MTQIPREQHSHITQQALPLPTAPHQLGLRVRQRQASAQQAPLLLSYETGQGCEEWEERTGKRWNKCNKKSRKMKI